MATSANLNYNTKGGVPASAGTDLTRVDRIDEGLPGESTYSFARTATGDPVSPTRQRLDSFKATGGQPAKQVATIDTTETSRNDRSADIKRGRPTVWG